MDSQTAPLSGDLKAQLGQMVAVRSTMGDHPELHYVCAEDLVLQHGTPYAAREIPEEYESGTPRKCFANSRFLAELHPELTYVEGYVFNGIAFHHAWLIDEAGEVVDPTHQIETAEIGQLIYMGIPFDLTIVQEHHRDRIWASLLNNFEHGHPLLREPFKPRV